MLERKSHQNSLKKPFNKVSYIVHNNSFLSKNNKNKKKSQVTGQQK